MTQSTQCSKCGVSILQITADDHDGCCVPCATRGGPNVSELQHELNQFFGWFKKSAGDIDEFEKLTFDDAGPFSEWNGVHESVDFDPEPQDKLWEVAAKMLNARTAEAVLNISRTYGAPDVDGTESFMAQQFGFSETFRWPHPHGHELYLGTATEFPTLFAGYGVIKLPTNLPDDE